MPLLLIHGIPGQSDVWLEVEEQVKNTFRVIVPDLLGFGKSPVAEDVFVEAQADAIWKLLADLEVRALHIVAHDYGAPIALTLMRRHPELDVQSLVVMATNFFPDTPVPVPMRLAKLPGLRTLLWPMLGTVPGARMAMRAGSGNVKPKPYRMAVRSARSTYRIFVRSLVHLKEIYTPIEEMARSLRIPSIVIWGTRDPFFSVNIGRRTADALNAEFRVLDGVGHFIPEEAPGSVVDAIRNVTGKVVPPAQVEGASRLM